jgi:hypothetical protein
LLFTIYNSQINFMKTIRYPEKAIWREILERPVFET